MRSAPPVDYPLARTGFWAGTTALLGVLALLTPLGWWGWHHQLEAPLAAPRWPWLLASVVAVAVGAVTWRWWASRRGVSGHVRWDGACWELRPTAGEPLSLATPSVQVDLGHGLLLRVRQRHGGRTCWLALERRDLPSAWHAVRVALAQARPADLPSPEGTTP